MGNHPCSYTLNQINDAEQWRARGEEMRAVAEDMLDPTNKATALRIAVDYERLARWAEERSGISEAKGWPPVR
jgi:hypothetical protein